MKNLFCKTTGKLFNFILIAATSSKPWLFISQYNLNAINFIFICYSNKLSSSRFFVYIFFYYDFKQIENEI